MANAQYQLGLLYEAGASVATDDAAAAAGWYRQAAEQGETAAQTRLGLMYLDGRGVAQDDVFAYAWLSLAAERAGEAAPAGQGVVQAHVELVRRMSEG